jgi:hypothetical protein
MNFFRTTYEKTSISIIDHCIYGAMLPTYLDGSNVGVLGDVLVLVQAILGSLAFAEFDGELDKQKHNRFEGSDRAAARPFRGDMFVEDVKGGRSLAHGDKFLSPLQAGFALVHALNFMFPFSISISNSGPTFRTFSGLICGGGGMVGDVLRGINDDYLYRARRAHKR